MALWTFVIEYGDDSTLVSQVEADDLDLALDLFNAGEDATGNDILLSSPSTCAEYGDLDRPVEIEGVKNVWCTSSLDKKERLVLANIIKTSQ